MPSERGIVVRSMLIGLGVASVATGAIGIFVPGLPTTVFLLAGSYCFARSSPRLHRRLVEHPRLGPFLRNAERRAMPARAKWFSVVAMWVGVGTAAYLLAPAGAAVPAILVAAGVVGTAVVLLWIRTSAPVAAN